MFTADDVIHTTLRADLLEWGDLVDVTTLARQAGFTVRVAVTLAVWARYVAFAPDDGAGQSEDGRLWDVLWMLRQASRRLPAAAEVEFQLLVAKADRGDWHPNEAVPVPGDGLTRETHRLVTLRAVIGPGDDAGPGKPDPVITILLPHED